MIIVKMNGGLGNQLQQYALYKKLESLGKEVKIDTNWFLEQSEKATGRELELSYFPKAEFQVCTKEELERILGKRNFFTKGMQKLHLMEKPLYVENQMYDPKIFEMDQKVLEGYWACEAYYVDIMDKLQQTLTFPKSDNPKNIALEKEMKEYNSVSIHIRRGDYLTSENAQMFGGICTDEYYQKAVEVILEKVANPHFYIFSDDTEYVRQVFLPQIMKLSKNTNSMALQTDGSRKEITIVDHNRGKESLFDMHLMSCCKHNVCANSTFSFWGARLNGYQGKMMIRPLKQKNCDWYVPEIMKELWRGWTLIDEKGQMC